MTDEELMEKMKVVLGKFEGKWADKDSWAFAMAIEDQIELLQAEVDLVYRHEIEATWKPGNKKAGKAILNPFNYTLRLKKKTFERMKFERMGHEKRR